MRQETAGTIEIIEMIVGVMILMEMHQAKIETKKEKMIRLDLYTSEFKNGI
jgi:hypothetical protein